MPSAVSPSIRPDARPMYTLLNHGTSDGQGYSHAGGLKSPNGSPAPSALSKTPEQIRKAYGFNHIANGEIIGDGTGQTIAIIAAYDNPNIFNDLTTFCAQYNLPAPDSSNFIKVDQRGGSDYPASNPDWAREIALDVQWVRALAPKATILLVEADSAGADLDIAVDYAKRVSGVTVVSMSYGSAEYSTETSDDGVYTSVPGNPVTFVASSGDDGGKVQYPAVSPNVLAVGGTSLYLNGSNGYASEKAWGYRDGSGTGGGVSLYEPKPNFQSGVTFGGTNRTVPDVAFNADPNTGVAVCDSFNGGSAPWFTIGGTSFSAPAWSAMIAIANQFRSLELKAPLDGPADTMSTLYALNSSSFRDVTTGFAGSLKAGAGYDLTTGLGTPRSSSVIAGLAGIPAPALPPDGEAVYVNTKTAAYTEPDGDRITITFTQPILTPANIDSIFKTAIVGTGYTLQKLDLTAVPGAAGTGLTISALRKVLGSDGVASIGLIDATGVDLGTVTVNGDLGRILAGDIDPTTAAITSLTVNSLGRLGTTTQAAGGNLLSSVAGAVKTLKVKGHVAAGTSFTLTGGVNGYINSLSVTGNYNGLLTIPGVLKTGGIGGDLLGNLQLTGNVTSLTIGGSVNGQAGSGKLSLSGNAGTLKINGSVLGGSVAQSGYVEIDGTVTTLAIGRDIIGGFATADNNTPTSAGAILIRGRAATITLGGSLVSGTTNGFSGVDLTGTGSLICDADIGSLTIMRNIIGRDVPAVISAHHQTLVGAKYALTDIAIGQLVIKGSVMDASILAGYDATGVAVDGSAQIGSVSVAGDWIRSSLLAGVDGAGALISTKDKAGTLAKINLFSVGGQLIGGNTGAKSFLVSTEQLVALKIGGVTRTLLAGAHNDNLSVGFYNQFFIKEV